MRYLYGLMCVCALGVMGCGETAGTGGSGGDGGQGGDGGSGGVGGQAGFGGSAGEGGSAGSGGEAGSGGTIGSGGSAGSAVSGGVGGIGGIGGDGGTGGAGGVDTVSVSAVITGFDAVQGPTGPLEGVEICETDTDSCVLTDAEGSATLQVPRDEEFIITFEKEGYQSELVAGLLSEEPPVFTNGLGTVERMEFLHGLVGSPYPMEGTGDVLVSWAELGAFPGATFVLVEPVPGKSFYYNEEGNWDADLTATTNYPLAPKGGFTEVIPGDAGVVQVGATGTAQSCLYLTGWPGAFGASVRVPIRAGYLSEVIVSCDVP